jgi:hypothetical protein
MLLLAICALVSIYGAEGLSISRPIMRSASAFVAGLVLPYSVSVHEATFHLPLAISNPVHVVEAADNKGGIVYKSGKTPEQFKNKNKDDKTGTKKDSKFLRCMSKCKIECQKPSDGLANLDCNQDCQDQCCETYEQCSFKVRTRSSEM